MKAFLLSTATLLISAQAFALTDLTNMTCEQAQDFIRAERNATVIYDYHPQAGRLYTKVYANRSNCRISARGGNTKPSWPIYADTVDNEKCYIGHSCG